MTLRIKSKKKARRTLPIPLASLKTLKDSGKTTSLWVVKFRQQKATQLRSGYKCRLIKGTIFCYNQLSISSTASGLDWLHLVHTSQLSHNSPGRILKTGADGFALQWYSDRFIVQTSSQYRFPKLHVLLNPFFQNWLKGHNFYLNTSASLLPVAFLLYVYVS